MTAAGITTSKFADKLRTVFSVEDGLWRDVQKRDLASAQKRFDTLFELSEGLPGDVRQNVRIKLEKVRHRLDYPLGKIREISDEKQRNHFIGQIIGEAIWNWVDGQKLQQVAYELAAWLPATTPHGDDDAGGGRAEAGGKPRKGKQPQTKHKARSKLAKNKRLTTEDEKLRNVILSRWDRAKSAGTTAKDFCKDEREKNDRTVRLTEPMLRKFISWRCQRVRRGHAGGR